MEGKYLFLNVIHIFHFGVAFYGDWLLIILHAIKCSGVRE